uniref:Uncharacterized protein n=1 Tax=Tanacetum cinerariifolium TaxID=118510 RepID=A0A699GYU8_TANCI|nr:hypothetical protein [Tanacetum cinerariifolium]
MGNIIRTRNSPDMLLGRFSMLSSLSKKCVDEASECFSCSRLGKGTISENMLLCCNPDTTYGLHPIRRISDESILVVEIDFTWSLGFGSVEPEARISLMMFEFSSCLFADSVMNLNPGPAALYCPEGRYAVLITQYTLYYLEEQTHHLDCRSQYAVLSGKVDTSYPTGGYGISVDLSEQDT